MKWLNLVMGKHKELESMFDLDFTYETTHRAYLKKFAIETCINFIGRSIAQSEFKIMEKQIRQFGDWDYLLNVRPNQNQSASTFWHKFAYKLIYDNEVLVIKTDKDQLLIADSFEREEYAVYPDTFKEVTIKDFTYSRTFPMDEVLYIDYNNEKLTKFMNGMFDDFAELFSRKLEVSLRNNQIRGEVGLDSAQSLDKENLTKLQKFIDRLFESFKSKSIALFPKLKGFEYNEIASGDHNGQSIEELTKLKKSLTNDVANILGIPTALIHGELAEYETSIKAYVRFCIKPFNEKIEDELNAKVITKEEYLKGARVDVFGLTERDLINNAQAVDKIVASGTFSKNEVRVMFGKDRVDDPEMDKYVMTKNYETVDSSEGGENKNESND